MPSTAYRDALELVEELAHEGILLLADHPIGPEARMSTLLENLNAKAIQLGIPLGVHLDSPGDATSAASIATSITTTKAR